MRCAVTTNGNFGLTNAGNPVVPAVVAMRKSGDVGSDEFSAKFTISRPTPPSGSKIPATSPPPESVNRELPWANCLAYSVAG
jgi:hypothetical protein